jgi:hypothetical protein
MLLRFPKMPGVSSQQPERSPPCGALEAGDGGDPDRGLIRYA